MTVYASVRFQSAEETLLTVATVDRRDLRVRWMERHFKHTQTFIPLGGKPFIVVLAPPNDKELPDLDQVRAFLFDKKVQLSYFCTLYQTSSVRLLIGVPSPSLLMARTSPTPSAYHST